MLFVSLRDLQWRRRRFIIGVLATGLVFALALVLTGVSGSFHNEVGRAVDAVGVDEWLVTRGASGPFTTTSLFGTDRLSAVQHLRGVRKAEPVIILRFTVKVGGTEKDLNVIGAGPGGIVHPKVHKGRSVRAPGEMVVDSSLGSHVGDTIKVEGRPYRVAGLTHGISYYAGTPVAFITLADAQKTLEGAPFTTAIVVSGRVKNPPSDLRVMSNSQVIADLRRPLKKATGTISFINILLWIVAAGIVGSLLYLQALERTRDFAVFKATGVTNRSLVTDLAFQAVVLAIFSAIAALFISLIIAPLLPITVEVPRSGYIALPIVAVIVGLLSSLFGLRRAVAVDPALAFGGA